MKYVKEEPDKNKELYVIELEINLKDKIHFLYEDIVLKDFKKDEVMEIVRQLRHLTQVLGKGNDFCRKTFKDEDKIYLTAKNGYKKLLSLHVVNGVYAHISVKKVVCFPVCGDGLVINDC